MKKVLFIHGFASSGQAQKAKDLKDILNDDQLTTEVIAPDLVHQPLQDIQTLEKIVRDNKIDMIVGSSLGGFYALVLALAHPHKLVLINPSLTPQQTLQDQLGYVESFKGGGFEWTKQQIQQLAELSQTIDAEHLSQKRYILDQCLVLLAQHDERLNYQEALTRLEGADIIIDTQQDHRFSNIHAYQQQLREFLMV